MTLMVEVENLSCRFGSFVAVDGISFQVPAGSIFGFLGPNGSGKSTTIRMLCGILAPSAGRARVGGFDVASQSVQVKGSLGYMSQKFSLYADLTVEENLDFFAKVYNLPAAEARARKAFLLDRLKLRGREGQITGNLSGGWKQRIALACAMIHRPRILFLDEPTAGIDPVARRDLWDLLFDLAKEGMTLFVTTHYMDEAERCTEVAYIYYGKLIVYGPPIQLKKAEIERAGMSLHVECEPLMPAIDVLRGIPEVADATVFGQAVHVKMRKAIARQGSDAFGILLTAASEAALINRIKATLMESCISVQEIFPIRPSLEDIFVHFTRTEDARRREGTAPRSGHA